MATRADITPPWADGGATGATGVVGMVVVGTAGGAAVGVLGVGVTETGWPGATEAG